MDLIYGESMLSKEGITQGNPQPKVMHAVAITPLIYRLTEEKLKEVWFDDASAAGKLAGLKSWWNNMTIIGPEYGYFPNSSKTWLIVKEKHLGKAKQLFHETGVKISYGGKSHLGSSIRSRPFLIVLLKRKCLNGKKNLSISLTSQWHDLWQRIPQMDISSKDGTEHRAPVGTTGRSYTRHVSTRH